VIEDDTLTGVSENSRWETDLGEGVELEVELDSGREVFVIQTALEDVDEELDTWRNQRVGQTVTEVDEITSVALQTGGQQTTLEVTLEDGYTFEADLLEEADRTDKGMDDLETEWTFEGQPGVEMGKQTDRDA
jgi:hypothetical protein